MNKKIFIIFLFPFSIMLASSYGYPNMFKVTLNSSYSNEDYDNKSMTNHSFFTIENTGSWPTTFLGFTLNPGDNFTLSTYLKYNYSGKFVVNGDANYYTNQNLLGSNKASSSLFLDESNGQALSTYIFSLFSNGNSLYANSTLCCAHIWNYACNTSGQTSKLLQTTPINGNDGYSTYVWPYNLCVQLIYSAGGAATITLPGIKSNRYVQANNHTWTEF